MLKKAVQKIKSEAQGVRQALDGQTDPAGSEPVQDEQDLWRADHGALKNALKDFALGNVVDRVDAFGEALPIFETVGFTLRRFDVEVGLSSGVSAHFDIRRIAEPDEQETALEMIRQDTVLEGVLRSMFSACRLHRIIKVGDLELTGLVVNLSTIPSVRLVFGEDLPE